MKHHFPLTEDDWKALVEEVVEDRVLLVFTGSFCGPTKLLMDTLTHFSLERDDYPIEIITIDVEKLPTITRRYEVKGTPQMIMLRDGWPVSSRIGTMSFEQLADYIDGELEAA